MTMALSICQTDIIQFIKTCNYGQYYDANTILYFYEKELQQYIGMSSIMINIIVDYCGDMISYKIFKNLGMKTISITIENQSSYKLCLRKWPSISLFNYDIVIEIENTQNVYKYVSVDELSENTIMDKLENHYNSGQVYSENIRTFINTYMEIKYNTYDFLGNINTSLCREYQTRYNKFTLLRTFTDSYLLLAVENEEIFEEMIHIIKFFYDILQ